MAEKPGLEECVEQAECEGNQRLCDSTGICQVQREGEIGRATQGVG